MAHTRVELEDKIKIKGDEYLVSELVDRLSYVNGPSAAEFFKSINLTIPIEVRMDTIKALLKDKVAKTIEERKHLADELGYRLSWFERYTDSQLVNLLEFYNTDGLLTIPYVSSLWLNIVDHFVKKHLSQEDLVKLVKLTDDKTATTKFKSKEFNDAINPIFHDKRGRIDGLTQSEFRPTTYRSATTAEIRAIGKKYNVDVPKRIKKAELLEIIYKELKDRKELTPELKAELASKNIMIIERFCKDNGIVASSELKKEEVIEYILENSVQTREAYYAPTTSIVYEKAVSKKVATAIHPTQTDPALKIEDPILAEPLHVVEEEKPAEPTSEAAVETDANLDDLEKRVAEVEDAVEDDEKKLSKHDRQIKEIKKVLKDLQEEKEVPAEADAAEAPADAVQTQESKGDQTVNVVVNAGDVNERLEKLQEQVDKIQEELDAKKPTAEQLEAERKKKRRRKIWMIILIVVEVIILLAVIVFLFGILNYFNDSIPVISPFINWLDSWTPFVRWIENFVEMIVGSRT